MSKYLIGAFGAVIGALALKGAYAKGRKKAYKEINEKLDLIVAVQDFKKKDGES